MGKNRVLIVDMNIKDGQQPAIICSTRHGPVLENENARVPLFAQLSLLFSIPPFLPKQTLRGSTCKPFFICGPLWFLLWCCLYLDYFSGPGALVSSSSYISHAGYVPYISILQTDSPSRLFYLIWLTNRTILSFSGPAIGNKEGGRDLHWSVFCWRQLSSIIFSVSRCFHADGFSRFFLLFCQRTIRWNSWNTCYHVCRADGTPDDWRISFQHMYTRREGERRVVCALLNVCLHWLFDYRHLVDYFFWQKLLWICWFITIMENWTGHQEAIPPFLGSKTGTGSSVRAHLVSKANERLAAALLFFYK